MEGGAGDSHHMADRSPAASPGAMSKRAPDQSIECESEREKKRQTVRKKTWTQKQAVLSEKIQTLYIIIFRCFIASQKNIYIHLFACIQNSDAALVVH